MSMIIGKTRGVVIDLAISLARARSAPVRPLGTERPDATGQCMSASMLARCSAALILEMVLLRLVSAAVRPAQQSACKVVSTHVCSGMRPQHTANTVDDTHSACFPVVANCRVDDTHSLASSYACFHVVAKHTVDDTHCACFHGVAKHTVNDTQGAYFHGVAKHTVDDSVIDTHYACFPVVAKRFACSEVRPEHSAHTFESNFDEQSLRLDSCCGQLIAT